MKCTIESLSEAGSVLNIAEFTGVNKQTIWDKARDYVGTEVNRKEVASVHIVFSDGTERTMTS